MWVEYTLFSKWKEKILYLMGTTCNLILKFKYNFKKKIGTETSNAIYSINFFQKVPHLLISVKLNVNTVSH